MIKYYKKKINKLSKIIFMKVGNFSIMLKEIENKITAIQNNFEIELRKQQGAINSNLII